MPGHWSFANPVEIDFGAARFAHVGPRIAGRRYALVTYGDPVFAELTQRLTTVAGPAAVVIDDVQPNPDFVALAPACARLRGAGIGLIVALGGGSAIDTAKVLAASGGEFDAVRSHLESGGKAKLPAPLPIVAIPTTAGTGSEVTCWATVWDGERKRKHSLADPRLYPEAAIVDPTLTHSLPRGLTLSTGLDALSHALESLWNRNANPVSATYAVAAAREILDVLPALLDRLGDAGLRARMAQAAVFAGLAFSNTKTALAHSLSYDVTLHHGVPHGIACSFTLPQVMRAAIGADADCDARLAAIFGADLRAGADRFADTLRAMGLRLEPAAYGVEAAAWRRFVDKAIGGERGQNFIGARERVLESFAST
ncbi:MAG: phosphonoacetaldehyde reductase [Alphaproteobacteria bacterium]|nr:phosphonoacetaldehyde reductase [Alphaproteobacteria bacterium]